MTVTSLTDRAIAAYLGLAIGDALGATVEFMTPREITETYGVHDEIRGGGWLRLKPGQVTDDTTMSLALGASILDAGKVDALAAAHAFDAWMRAKPVDIGNTVRRNLIQFRNSGRPEAPCSDHDAGNGAAMRILPVALATIGQDATSIRAACRAQGHITHNNHLSDAASECLALMVQAALSGRDKNYLLYEYALATAATHPVFKFRDVRLRENPSGFIVDTIQAVFQSFFDTDDFRGCLVAVVNRGGDADTTGAIAGMLAGALYGMDGIPTSWLSKLDSGIRDVCTSQARLLIELAAKQDTSTPPAITVFQSR
jgi:ADP-ribosyl-[dinitrogen reductase] hydrolase